MSGEPTSLRDCRYEAAIVRDDEIVLIEHVARSGHRWWMLPGGGRFVGEDEHACVVREAFEETFLEVEVVRLLLDHLTPADDPVYRRMKTYLCRVVGGDLKPGVEPEPDVIAIDLADARWWSLADPTRWDASIREDRYTAPKLHAIREALGYA